METEKLFYQDSHLRRFAAKVLDCRPEKEGRFAVVLDRTAFYPEGGGQAADRGTLGGVNVLDVREKGGELFHLTDGPLPLGEEVTGELDWEHRFDLMQQHTGEHIVSGLVHALFGWDNVGFHMGADCVTIDFSGELTAGQVEQVETLANEAIWKNLPVEVTWPDAETLKTLPYRSKKELTGAVRIVSVPGYDCCACCGTHVSRTGEVGCIRLFGAQRFRGGTRMSFLSGRKALEDYRQKSKSVFSISAQLSAKPVEVAQAVEKLKQEESALRQRISSLQQQVFAEKLSSFAPGEKIFLFEPGLDAAGVWQLCLLAVEKGSAAAVFSPAEGQVRYAVGSAELDVRPFGKLLNERFCGRGGGKPQMVQGNLGAGAEEAALRAFVEEKL